MGEKKRGKRDNQKLKPYVVYQYLMRNTDEDHVVSAAEIVAYLEECGIGAERRSVYRDIDDINKVIWMVENDADIEEAAEAAAADEEKTIIYDAHKKGFYVRQRHHDLNDIRLLAECVYSAKFIPQGQADRLIDTVCEFVSEPQAEKIRRDNFVIDRVKTANKGILNSLSTINDAMSRNLDGRPHTPQKISFKYLKYVIGDLSQQVERRKGEKYIVSPFKLLINGQNYYLLAYDGKGKKLKTYRVDRMKDVRFVDEPREGADAFKEIDLRTYTQRVFSMYGGEPQRVSIRFINPLLDTVVEQFGTGAFYRPDDDKHFIVSADVEISDQFFAWVCGFGKRAKIVEPPAAVEKFAAYLDKIREMY